MEFQTPLVPARLIRRYKRFLADVLLDDGTEAVAHCPNPGAMTGLAVPGQRIWLEPNDDPRRALRFGWRLTEIGTETGTDTAGGFALVDTSAANRLVAEALRCGRIPSLSGYAGRRAEVRYGTRGSRADFLLTEGPHPDAVVEVKSVTLSRRPGLAEFPDTVTARGARHMAELADVAAAGGRAVVLYLLARTDCDRVGLAGDIDPAYARAAEAAHAAGAEVIACTCRISPGGVEIDGEAPFAAGFSAR